MVPAPLSSSFYRTFIPSGPIGVEVRIVEILRFGDGILERCPTWGRQGGKKAKTQMALQVLPVTVFFLFGGRECF